MSQNIFTNDEESTNTIESNFEAFCEEFNITEKDKPNFFFVYNRGACAVLDVVKSNAEIESFEIISIMDAHSIVASLDTIEDEINEYLGNTDPDDIVLTVMS